MEGSPDKKRAFRGYTCSRPGLSFENDMSFLVQEVTGVQHHNMDEKRVVTDVNDAPVSLLCHRQNSSRLSLCSNGLIPKFTKTGRLRCFMLKVTSIVSKNKVGE